MVFERNIDERKDGHGVPALRIVVEEFRARGSILSIMTR